LEQITSIYLMRRLVEPFAARHAARRLSRLDISRAADLNRNLAAAYEANDEVSARRYNREFHWVIYRACGFPTLFSEIERLWAAFPWAVLQVSPDRSVAVREHEALLKALAADDQEAIQTILETHISGGHFALVKQLGGQSESDPFEISELADIV
jgi:DNA-binding GntR family transcriptional regulator